MQIDERTHGPKVDTAGVENVEITQYRKYNKTVMWQLKLITLSQLLLYYNVEDHITSKITCSKGEVTLKLHNNLKIYYSTNP